MSVSISRLREGTITLASDGLPVDDVFYFSVPSEKRCECC